MRAIQVLMMLALPAMPAQAQSPRVLTDIAPVQSLVAQVMQGAGTPDLLLSGDDDPHHMALRPSQARAVARADLVIWIGPALTPWLTPVLAQRSGPNMALTPDLVEGVDDPHLWLDPATALRWLPVIAETLAASDPDNAALYHRNAATAAAGLTDLTLQVLAILADHRAAGLITAHDAWGHFADAFGLQIVGAIRKDDHATPGAQHLSDLRALVTSGAVACVLSEGPDTDDLVVTVIGDARVPATSAHPLGPDVPTGADFYGTHMLGVAKSIAGCVSRS